MSTIGPTPAEQHLGDRLAALIDGELKHDVRDRVLAHLATCPKCKAEADAQRRLKSVFAATAPPPPSEGFLARLQGLPGGPPGGQPAADDDSSSGPFGRGGLGRGRFGDGVFGMTAEDFGYVPARHGLPGGAPGSGFRIHDVGRAEAERSVWRGRRFALTAASAVSFAAIALGGTLPLAAPGDSAARGEQRGNNVTPMRSTTPSAVSTGGDTGRRRGGAGGEQAMGALQQPLAQTQPPAAQPFAASSLLPGVPSPLIRPTGSVFQLAIASGPAPTATPHPTRLASPTGR
ncbi:zf-HC2 domain-containing protein [Streptomyces sp. NPDC007861]|uniref:anti-sigma factor family protein n=1 Tax=Streptomyces sp. NPDC007861 TaxID=3154893 RepID=UPI0034080EAA